MQHTRTLVAVLTVGWFGSGAGWGVGTTDPDRVGWLRQNASRIAHSTPAGGQDVGVDALLEAIGEARVVQLGEMTHGDGTAFVLRARLIRSIVDRLGFDAVVFESGFYETREVDQALSDPSVELGEAIREGVYPIWAESEQMRPLFSWLRGTRGTDRPVEFFGYDVQFSRPGTGDRMPGVVSELVESATGVVMSAEARETLAELCDTIGASGAIMIGDAAHERFGEVLGRLTAALEDPVDASAAGVAGRVVAGLSRMEEVMYWRSKAPRFDPSDPGRSLNSPFTIRAKNARDLGMAENLAWWLEGPGGGRRAVVWAANSHVQHAGGGGVEQPEENPTPAGAHLRRELGDEVYTVLSVVYGGSWAAPSVRTAEGELRWMGGDHAPAEPESLAGLMHRAGHDISFLDLRPLRAMPDHWLNRPIVIRQDMFGGKPVLLSELCDGILFIDRMEPSTPVRE